MTAAMSASHVGRACLYRRPHLAPSSFPFSSLREHHAGAAWARRPVPRRKFTSSRGAYKHRPSEGEKESSTSRAGKAWRSTRIEWKPIPIALGIAFLGAFQLYRIQRREGAD